MGRRSVPKMGRVNHSGNYLYRDPNPNQWKKFCIIQCNDRVWNPNPSLFLLVEMSHNGTSVKYVYVISQWIIPNNLPQCVSGGINVCDGLCDVCTG